MSQTQQQELQQQKPIIRFNTINQPRFSKFIIILLVFLLFSILNFSLYLLLKPFDPSPNQDLANWLKLASPITQQHIPNSQPSSKKSKLKPNDLKPFYVWLGPLPERHKTMLKSLNHPFRVYRNCDLLMKKMEEQLLQKFDPWIYQTINLKSDICRFIVLYYEGGLYIDMDAEVDLDCMSKYLTDKQIFFQATERGTVDIFTIYSAKPYDPEIYKAIESWTTFKSYLPYNTYLSTRISNSVKTIARSGCVIHKQERSWKLLLTPGNDGK